MKRDDLLDASISRFVWFAILAAVLLFMSCGGRPLADGSDAGADCARLRVCPALETTKSGAAWDCATPSACGTPCWLCERDGQAVASPGNPCELAQGASRIVCVASCAECRP